MEVHFLKVSILARILGPYEEGMDIIYIKGGHCTRVQWAGLGSVGLSSSLHG